jgi:CBS domain containing-hemolysin-like protein
VVGLTSIVILILGLPAVAAHLASVMFTRALRSYSRSRLEDYSDRRGHPERASQVAHLDERTERSAEAIAVVSGLFGAALIGVLLERKTSPAGLAWVALLFLLLIASGYLLAGVVGKVFAEPIVDAFWPAASMVRGLAWPLVRAAQGLEFLTEKYAGGPESSPRPASVEVEIRTEDGETSEDVEADLSEETMALLQHAVELSRTDVSEVMIPASAIVSLAATVTAPDAAETFRRTGRSRIPIFGSNRDDIIGILIAKDLWDRMVEARGPESVVPAKLVRPAFCVPETANAFQLIEDLRRHRTQMAVVLDEYGAVAGLVTLEDLLEQLVGPIEDEHDTPAPQDPIVAVGGSRYELVAALSLEDLNDRFDLHLPTEEDFETVGGLALHALGRLPELGANFRYAGIEFTILDVRDRSIRRVLIDLEPATTAVDGA